MEGLQYSGKVDIFMQRKGKNQHLSTVNSGLQGISELFTRCCLGYPTEEYRPYYLDMRDSGGESILYSPVQLRASTYSSVTQDMAQTDSYMVGWKYPIFDGIILSDNIKSISGGDYTLVLTSISGIELAKVSLQVSVGEAVGTFPHLILSNLNNSILVRWSLFLSNKEET